MEHKIENNQAVETLSSDRVCLREELSSTCSPYLASEVGKAQVSLPLKAGLELRTYRGENLTMMVERNYSNT